MKTGVLSIFGWILLACAHSASITNSGPYSLGCYFTYWSLANKSGFKISDISGDLCTHVFYSFIKINNGVLHAYPDDYNMATNIAALKTLRDQNPGLKIVISVGGGNEGSAPFLYVTQDSQRLASFVENVISFLSQYDLDGIDIDWESPWCYSEWSADTHARLIETLYAGFKAHNGPRKLLLSASLKPLTEYSFDSNCQWIPTPRPFYDVPKISRSLDLALVMTYDMRGTWNGVTGLHAALYGPDDNSDAVIQSFISKGMPRSLILLGVPTYGRSWTLQQPGQNGVGASSSTPGWPGETTGAAGILSYTEICTRLNIGWRRQFDNKRVGPYAYNNNQWVGYEDAQSSAIKADYVVERKLGGAFYWSLELDDFSNQCSGGSYPILSSVAKVLRGTGGQTLQPTTPSTTPKPPITTRSPTASPPASEFTCPTDFGFFADSLDCSRYYQCSFGAATHGNCPPGLLWNQAMAYCDWPQNVNCPSI